MKTKSKSTGRKVQIMSWVITVAAMPLVFTATGCAGDRYTQSTGEVIDDRADSSRVRRALNDDKVYKYEGINITTFKGVVQLSGFVDTRDEKSRAATVAKGVEGVKEVKNNITVK